MTTIVTFSTSAQRDAVREFIRSKISEPKMELMEFTYALRNKFMPEQNLEFLDDLIGLCDFDKKYSIEVPYEKLFDYGIPRTTDTGNINKRLARSHLEENKDYIVIRIPNMPNRYTITPDAFHRLLKDARIPKSRETVFGTGDYSDFIQFILGCVNYYSEYCKIRLENDKARLENENVNLQQTILNITATLNSIKRDTTQITKQNVDLEDKVDYITHQNDELKDQNADLEVKLNNVSDQNADLKVKLNHVSEQNTNLGAQLTHVTKQNDGMAKTLHDVANHLAVPHPNASKESTLTLVGVIGKDTAKQVKYIGLREIRRQHGDAVRETKKFLNGTYTVNSNRPNQRYHKIICPPIAVPNQDALIASIRSKISKHVSDAIDAEYSATNKSLFTKIDQRVEELANLAKEIKKIKSRIYYQKRTRANGPDAKSLDALNSKLTKTLAQQSSITSEIESLKKQITPKRQSPIKFHANTVTCEENDLMGADVIFEMYLNEILNTRGCRYSMSSINELQEFQESNDNKLVASFESEFCDSMKQFVTDANLGYAQVIDRIKKYLTDFDEQSIEASKIKPRYDPDANGTLLPPSYEDISANGCDSDDEF